MGNTLARRYIGSSSSEQEAAQLYDRKSIASNGLTAKTNFSYTKSQIEDILEAEEREQREFENLEASNPDQHRSPLSK